MPWGVLLLMVSASLAVALFVSWPLLMGKAEPDTAAEERPIAQLLAQKDTVYSAIKELEFDHAMGNLSDQDFRELSGRYEDRAVALLQSIDEVSQAEEVTVDSGSVATGGLMRSKSRAASPEDAIEEEVAALRAKRRAKAGSTEGHDLGDEIEAQVAAMRVARQGKAVERSPIASPSSSPSPRVICPSCASPVKNAGAAYCSRCGASLRASCPSCGEAVEARDAFCSACGAQLGSGGSQAEVTTVGGAHA